MTPPRFLSFLPKSNKPSTLEPTPSFQLRWLSKQGFVRKHVVKKSKKEKFRFNARNTLVVSAALCLGIHVDGYVGFCEATAWS